ncbi:hypothetical protein [Zavarzinella formosa]|uniref:hypothetical protein n=1 Tax=Zavarzinella formosa TaxID=360055 RepID=UPI0003119951|nr:hypothetical protein [Zavarzinella formosa]
MTFDPARPRHTLKLADREYELLGTFEVIEAVEWAMKEPLGQVVVSLVNGLASVPLARLLSAVLTACGHPLGAKEAGAILWNDIGLSGEAYDTLRLNLYAFLTVCLAPPAGREARANEVGEMLGRLARPVSRGKTTSGSASASSAGARTSSGKAPSGKSPRPTRAGR